MSTMKNVLDDGEAAIKTDENLMPYKKRFPDAEAAADHHAAENVVAADQAENQTKRFKSNNNNNKYNAQANWPETPIIMPFMHQKSFHKRVLNYDEDIRFLSPITELANDLCEATLGTPKAATSMQQQQQQQQQGTPLNHLRGKSGTSRKLKLQTFNGCDDNARNTHDNGNMKTPEKEQHFYVEAAKSYNQSNNTARRLNLSNSMHTDMMLVDDDDEHQLSFYGDEVDCAAQQQTTHASYILRSPKMLQSELLLPAETSPQHFQIVQKQPSKTQATAAARQLKLTGSTNASRNANSAAGTPAKHIRVFNSLSPGSVESSIDDEYRELFEMESLDEHQAINYPSDMTSLFSAQIKSANALAAAESNMRMPSMRRPAVRRCLSLNENQQPKTPELFKHTNKHNTQETVNTTPVSAARLNDSSNSCTPISSIGQFKRPEPPSSTASSPAHAKRHRIVDKENLALPSNNNNITMPTVLRKCVSMNDAQIMSALARSDSNDGAELIGDFSRPFALPLLAGRHRDLKSISSETVARLLRGEFSEQVANYKIIDCRYPYEFEGGHIRGAKNLYMPEQIMSEFLSQSKTEATAPGQKRNIIIFHCEFSSERGPKLSRFLRNNDRARNESSYPALQYPEIYLLHNGYKDFYETHAELCDPVAYRPMLEPGYTEAYRQFRAKSKSWNGDGGLGGATSRVKKSRSRLML